MKLEYKGEVFESACDNANEFESNMIELACYHWIDVELDSIDRTIRKVYNSVRIYTTSELYLMAQEEANNSDLVQLINVEDLASYYNVRYSFTANRDDYYAKY